MRRERACEKSRHRMRELTKYSRHDSSLTNNTFCHLRKSMNRSGFENNKPEEDFQVDEC